MSSKRTMAAPWRKSALFGLLEALKAAELKDGLGLAELGTPPVLNLECGLDTENEILVPGGDFVGLWREIFGAEGMEEWVLERHNNISPPVAVMSGDKEGGSRVRIWCIG